MTIAQIIFIIIAAASLGAAFMVVSSRNLIHSALWLIVALAGIAIVFVFLQAPFLAVVQVVVYIGAISILLIFAIMLTRKVASDSGPKFNENWIWGLVLSIILFIGFVYLLYTWPGISTPIEPLASRADPLRELGVALVSPNGYVLAFELASILLLAALIGAIYIAWERK